MTTAAIPLAIRDLLRFTRTHLRHHDALMKATGGHFNLFQILGIGHYEVRTHSPILAELLNPQGRHGQGEIFLSLFLNSLGIPDTEFAADGSKVTAEYHIGNKTEDTGGRIDLVIQDAQGRRIMIENKIYAGDQENQLTRYRNFDPDARLFYLTLFGDMPSNLTKAEAEDIRCEPISYEIQILRWLKECRKEAACLPGVREMLSQYIALIEELTNQSTSKEMNADLIQHIIENPENLKAFFALRDAGRAVQASLFEKLDEDLSQIANQLGLEKKDPAKDMHTKDSLFSFSTPSLEQNDLRIGFTFGSGNFCDLDFGFVRLNANKPCSIENDLQSEFAKIFALKKTRWWPAYANYEQPYRTWSYDAFEGVRSGQFAENVKKKLVLLMEIANKVCKAQNQSISKT